MLRGGSILLQQIENIQSAQIFPTLFEPFANRQAEGSVVLFY